MSGRRQKPYRIIELANDLSTEGINPAINAIEIVGDNEKTDSTNVLRKSVNYEMLRYTDLGVFRGDKLVGWLNEDEAKGYNYITGNVKHTTGHTDENGLELSFMVIKAGSKIKASVENNQPKVDVVISVQYIIAGEDGQLDLSKLENVDVVNKMAERRLTRMCEETVRKAQRELKTDVFGFGERIHEADGKYWKTVKDQWNDVFTDLQVNIKVNPELVATGDISKTIVKK